MTEHVIFDTLTLKQFLRLPEAKPALEYIDGKVIQKVSPKATHSEIQAELTTALRNHARPQQLGKAYTELRCTFAGRSLVFDLCYFTRERIPRDPHGRLIDDILIPPDLAIEILSPGQTVKAISARLTWCVAHGVRLGWLIQPRRERVFVFRPQQPIETLEIGATLTGEDVVPDFTLTLAELFGWLVEE